MRVALRMQRGRGGKSHTGIQEHRLRRKRRPNTIDQRVLGTSGMRGSYLNGQLATLQACSGLCEITEGNVLGPHQIVSTLVDRGEWSPNTKTNVGIEYREIQRSRMLRQGSSSVI